MPRLTYAIGAAAAVAALALSAATVVPATAADRPDSSPKTTYYLSLGDSLSAGDQPNAKGVTLPTNQGYADQLYNTIKSAHPGLRLWKLGCPGETSATLNKGGICGYKGEERYSLNADKGSQLAAALRFLRGERPESLPHAHLNRRDRQLPDPGVPCHPEEPGRDAREAARG
jgi:hypothetical protein